MAISWIMKEIMEEINYDNTIWLLGVARLSFELHIAKLHDIDFNLPTVVVNLW